MATYTPFWLHSLDAPRREEVVAWLVSHGVDVDRCASFDLDKGMVTAHMYAVGQENLPIFDPEVGGPVLAEPKIFLPRALPAALRYQ